MQSDTLRTRLRKIQPSRAFHKVTDKLKRSRVSDDNSEPRTLSADMESSGQIPAKPSSSLSSSAVGDSDTSPPGSSRTSGSSDVFFDATSERCSTGATASPDPIEHTGLAMASSHGQSPAPKRLRENSPPKAAVEWFSKRSPASQSSAAATATTAAASDSNADARLELRTWAAHQAVRCKKCYVSVFVGPDKVAAHAKAMLEGNFGRGIVVAVPADHHSVIAEDLPLTPSPATSSSSSSSKPAKIVHPCMTCPRCSAFICMGCSKQVDRKDLEKGKPVSTSTLDGKFQISWHCSAGRLFLIWMFACGLTTGPPAKTTSGVGSGVGSSAGSSGVIRPLLDTIMPSSLKPSNFLSPKFSKQQKLPLVDKGASSGPKTPSSPTPSTSTSTDKPKASSAPGSPAHTTNISDAHNMFISFGFPVTGLGNKKNGGNAAQAAGTGYGGHGGIGYGGHKSHSGGSSSNSTSSHKKDKLTGSYMWCLAALLPKPQGSSASDTASGFDLPPRLVELMLRRSPLISLSAELLRNHSPEDMSSREYLYGSLCDFLTALVKNGGLQHLILVRTPLYPVEEQTMGATFGLGPSTDKAKDPERAGDSLATLVDVLSSHCQVLLKKAAIHGDEFQSPQDRRMLEICDSVCELRDSIGVQQRLKERENTNEKAKEKAADVAQQRPTINAPQDKGPKSGGSAASRSSLSALSTALASLPSAPKITDEERQARLREWWKSHAMEEVADGDLLNTFAFNHEAAKLESESPQRGRMKRLISEIASLRMSLPEGIFVRHGSARMDTLKVIITGPSGTPYSHGLFEFDLFCPGGYPNSPPQMLFKTTGGGRIRFNPNLYDDGKVCLSLLGTWHQGQPWVAGQSTILQILVSIQGMIFCEEPWYNEPGREAQRNKQMSERENALLSEGTIEHAMIPWLRALASRTTAAATLPPRTPPVRHLHQKVFAFPPAPPPPSQEEIQETIAKWKALESSIPVNAPPPPTPQAALDQMSLNPTMGVPLQQKMAQIHGAATHDFLMLQAQIMAITEQHANAQSTMEASMLQQEKEALVSQATQALVKAKLAQKKMMGSGQSGALSAKTPTLQTDVVSPTPMPVPQVVWSTQPEPLAPEASAAPKIMASAAAAASSSSSASFAQQLQPPPPPPPPPPPSASPATPGMHPVFWPTLPGVHHPIPHPATAFLAAAVKKSAGVSGPSMPPPAGHELGIWEDVVREHFAANAGVILATARQWRRANEAPMKLMKRQSRIGSLIDELEGLFKALGYS